MSCAELTEAISAHLDAELTGSEAAAVEAHLTSCGDCRKRHDGFRALKHAVARLHGRVEPPEAVHARVEALRFRRAPAWGRFAFAGSAAAAVLLATLVVGRLWTVVEEEDPLPSELIADHLRSAPDVMPAEISSADRGEVARFFRAKVPFEPVVPRLGSAQLIGGRVCKIQGRKVQLLFYELGERKLSLYVSDRPTSMEKCHEDGGHCVCGKQLAGLSLMLVGRGPESEMRQLLDEAVL